MRILITGGAGFIGSHLADELLARGHDVHVLDDLSTGAIDNIRHLKDHAALRVHDRHRRERAAGRRARRRGRRRLPPRRRRRRRADRREPGADDRDQRALHRGRARRRPARRRSRSSSPRPARSTARAPTCPFREDGDLLLGPTDKGRWSYACSKAIDEFLALAYWKERKLPDGRRAPVQHGRPAADRPLRHGRADLRRARRWPASRSRSTATARSSRCFCHVDDVVARARRPDGARGRSTARSSTSASHGGDHDPRARRAGPQDRPARTRRSRSSRTTRPTRRASRTCSAACPTSRRSARRSAGSPTRTLDEILTDVLDDQLAARGVASLAA